MGRTIAFRSGMIPRIGKPTTVEAFYKRAVEYTGRHSRHLLHLRQFSSGLHRCAELGVRRGSSSAALLMGAQEVIGLDIQRTDEANYLEKIARTRWSYVIADSRTYKLPPVDLLFIDSRHTAAHVAAELKLQGEQVRRYLIFHDTTRFGVKGEDGGPGILTAIDAWRLLHPEWREHIHYPEGSGLLVLERMS